MYPIWLTDFDTVNYQSKLECDSTIVWNLVRVSGSRRLESDKPELQMLAADNNLRFELK